MNIEEIRKGAPDGAEYYNILIVDEYIRANYYKYIEGVLMWYAFTGEWKHSKANDSEIKPLY